MTTPTPLLAAALEALGPDTYRFLVPDPLGLVASSGHSTRRIATMRWTRAGGASAHDAKGQEIYGAPRRCAALLRDWFCQYPDAPLTSSPT